MTAKMAKSVGYTTLLCICLCISLMSIGEVSSQALCPANGNSLFGCTCIEKFSEVICENTQNKQIPSNLPNVKALNITGNKNITILTKISYQYLEKLYIRENGISEIVEGAFSGAIKLQDVIFQNENNMKHNSITPKTFAGAPKLAMIEFQNSDISSVKARVFSDVIPSLMQVKITYSELYEVEDDAFANSTKLHHIGLHDNRLTTIPLFSIHKPLQSLETLDMSNNSIGRLLNLRNMPKLKHLNMVNNKLTHVSNGAFEHISLTVEIIELSSNNIETIGPLAFARLQVLKELNLDNNRLTHVLWEELPWGNLDTITLYGNPWACDYKNAYLVEKDNEPIRKYNSDAQNNRVLRCESPKAVEGDVMFDVDKNYFLSEATPSQHTQGKTAATVIIVLVCLLLLGIVIFVVWNMRRKKRREYSNTPYTHFSSKDGIVQYSDDDRSEFQM